MILKGDCIETQICDHLYYLRRYIEVRARGSKADAEDIYGEVVVKIWEIIRKGKFREGFSVSVFLQYCANSMIVNYYRKKGRTKRTHSDEYDYCFGNFTRSYEKEYEALERNEIFMEQVREKLNDTDRKILILSIYQDMKHYEIADTLGIPRGSVSSQLSRAREKFGDIHLNKVRSRTVIQ